MHLHHDYPDGERLHEATYTVKTLIAAKAMGNGAANVTTWQYQNTGSAEAVCRSLAFQGQSGATGEVSVEIGVTGATSEVDQRIIDQYVLTAGTPYFVNGWYTVAASSYLQGFANATTVNGAAYGVIST